MAGCSLTFTATRGDVGRKGLLQDLKAQKNGQPRYELACLGSFLIEHIIAATQLETTHCAAPRQLAYLASASNAPALKQRHPLGFPQLEGFYVAINGSSRSRYRH